VTLPTHDAQPARSIPRRPQMISPTHSISTLPPKRPATPFSSIPSPVRSVPDQEKTQPHEHALDFATHSWDLATGGLKTLTAKREFPHRPDRRQPEQTGMERATASSYKLTLIILTCVVLMLIGGGMVLLVMLQL
jgi:hypothetical protein